MKYNFAVNEIKLNRAIALSNSDSEEAVLEQYIKLGGKVKDGYEVEPKKKGKKEEPEVVEEVVIEPVEEPKKTNMFKM